MDYCEEHQQTIVKLNSVDNKINFMEKLMTKIDKELVDLKKGMAELNDKIHKLEIRQSEIPIKTILIICGIASGVSAIVAPIVTILLKIMGVF